MNNRLALSLLKMGCTTLSVSPRIDAFRQKFKGTLSKSAFNSLARLSPGGQTRLEQLGKSLSWRLKRGFSDGQEIKADDFGRLSFTIGCGKIVKLAEKLDRSKGQVVSLKPILIDKTFQLVTREEWIELEEGVRRGELNPEEHPLEFPAYSTPEREGPGGMRSHVVSAPAMIRVQIEQVEPAKTVAREVQAKSASLSTRRIKPAIVRGTMFNEAQTTSDLARIYQEAMTTSDSKVKDFASKSPKYLAGMIVSISVWALSLGLGFVGVIPFLLPPIFTGFLLSVIYFRYCNETDKEFAIIKNNNIKAQMAGVLFGLKTGKAVCVLSELDTSTKNDLGNYLLKLDPGMADTLGCKLNEQVRSLQSGEDNFSPNRFEKIPQVAVPELSANYEMIGAAEQEVDAAEEAAKEEQQSKG